MEALHGTLRMGRIWALSGALFLAVVTGQSQAQDKGDAERAKVLQKELELNQEEMIKLLKANREEMRKALARIQVRIPGPAAAQPGGAAALTRDHAGPGRDYRVGVVLCPPSATLREHLKLEAGVGLVITEVYVDSAASKAGLKVSDILIELNGKKVPSDYAKYSEIVREIKSDVEVGGVVLRKGAPENFKITLPNIVVVPLHAHASGGFTEVPLPFPARATVIPPAPAAEKK